MCNVLRIVHTVRFITARKRSWRQGNVFTPVCQSFCLQWPPKRAVRIQLECILVSFAMGFFKNFFLQFKAVCSHGATTISINAYIGITHCYHTELVWNPFMCNSMHTNASQGHQMNRLIDIHLTHCLLHSHSQKYRTV